VVTPQPSRTIPFWLNYVPTKTSSLRVDNPLTMPGHDLAQK